MYEKGMKIEGWMILKGNEMQKKPNENVLNFHWVNESKNCNKKNDSKDAHPAQFPPQNSTHKNSFNRSYICIYIVCLSTFFSIFLFLLFCISTHHQNARDTDQKVKTKTAWKSFDSQKRHIFLSYFISCCKWWPMVSCEMTFYGIETSIIPHTHTLTWCCLHHLQRELFLT